MPFNRTLIANETTPNPVTFDLAPVDDAQLLVKPEVISGADDTVNVSATVNGTDHQLDSTTVSAVDGSDDYSLALPDVKSIKIETANDERFTMDVVGEPR